MELLILLTLCHFLGDYTHFVNGWRDGWMLKAKRYGTPLTPIAVHALIHAGLMSVVLHAFVYWKGALILTCFQFWAHFIIDILKGKLNVWFPSLVDPNGRPHWYVFGADQFAHLLCIYYMVNLALNFPLTHSSYWLL